MRENLVPVLLLPPRCGSDTFSCSRTLRTGVYGTFLSFFTTSDRSIFVVQVPAWTGVCQLPRHDT